MGRSSLQQPLLFTNKLIEAKSVRPEVDVIYMDFRKALDLALHNGLLMKLHSAGIAGKLWLWLQTYLKYRFQCVHVGNSKSEFCNVLSGVPQGNVLGPLLFAIFINDLSQSLNSATPFRSADDTKCVHSVKSFNDITKLQIDINAIYPLGASPQIFCSTNLNLFIFISR